MGGIKNYWLVDVVGKTSKNEKSRKKFLHSIKNDKPQKIVSSALKLASDSNQFFSILTNAMTAFEFIKENAEAVPLNSEARKRVAREFWANKKKEENISSDLKVDEIIVSSLANVIHKGKKK